MSGWRETGRDAARDTRRWRMVALVAAGLTGLGIVVMATSAPEAPPVQQVDTIDLIRNNDPLTKFSKLMPVLTHDRCANCHGDVNPFTGDNHEGGMLDPAVAAPLRDPDGDQILGTDFNQPCRASGCHTDPQARFWALAPKKTRFAGQSASAICGEIQDNPKFNTATSLRKHVREDELILAGFIGTRGFLNTSPDRPRMSAADFSRLAEEWLKDSVEDKIRCSGWVGTIFQTETVNSIAKGNTATGGFSTEREDTAIATRTVKVFVNGGVKVEISVQAKQTVGETIVSPDCSTTSLNVVDVHPKGAETTVGEAQKAEILFTPGGRYYISIKGPDEINERVERSDVSLCGLMSLPGQPTAVNLPHDGWVIGMDGVLPDPSNRTRLNGMTSGVIRTEHDAWLTGSGGVLAPFQIQGNGSETVPVKVSVTTEWDLRQLR